MSDLMSVIFMRFWKHNLNFGSLMFLIFFIEPTTVGIDIEYQLLEAAKAGDIEVVKVCFAIFKL